MGEVMPGSYMSNDDCFDLFIDFIESDEWLLPIESFIDYFCIMFPTMDYNENRTEKMKIFQEYQAIVKLNLETFLTDILNYNGEQLSNLLAIYDNHLEFEDMMYILAVEDYNIFHDFMHEASQAQMRGQVVLGHTRRNRGAYQKQTSAQHGYMGGVSGMGGMGGMGGSGIGGPGGNRAISEEDLI